MPAPSYQGQGTGLATTQIPQAQLDLAKAGQPSGLATTQTPVTDMIQPVTIILSRGVYVPGSDGVVMQIFSADCVPEERHEDQLEITQHPVEQGSMVSDHAFKLPAEVTLNYLWAMGSKQNTNQDAYFLRSTYETFLAIQQNKILFYVVTGKRDYSNMLLKNVTVHTDPVNENVLNMRLVCRELLMANVQISTSSAASMSDPESTAPIQPGGQKNLSPGSGWNPRYHDQFIGVPLPSGGGS